MAHGSWLEAGSLLEDQRQLTGGDARGEAFSEWKAKSEMAQGKACRSLL